MREAALDSAKASDRITALALYLGLLALTVWIGIRWVNGALESKFYKAYLVKWEISLKGYTAQGGMLPRFSGSNHVVYMDALVQGMEAVGIDPPSSNTPRAYIYRIDHLLAPGEELFLLCFATRIVIYGLSQTTGY